MTTPDAAALEYCRAILPRVSRTFALTIPALPEPLYAPVCCAYLLCRIVDTIEDSEHLPAESRQELYARFERLVRGCPQGDDLAALSGNWARPEEPAYAELLSNTGKVLRLFRSLPPEQQAPIATCVGEMLTGMRTLSERRGAERPHYVCNDLDELEQYCHYVAGVVGIMLTQLFHLHLGDARLADPAVLEQGRRFGIGLQLTNILKDQVDDLARGTSFVPQSWTDAGQLTPERRHQLLLRTLEHLDVALEYTLALPAHAQGLRLFCAWALWMAVATLEVIASGSGDKISRTDVQRIVDTTSRHGSDNTALRQSYAGYRNAALRQLTAT